jgi:DNA repair photolyase
MFYTLAMRVSEVVETECKAALNRVSGMPFRWSLNPYRGCVHGCHYCYARATHAHYGLNAGDDFVSRLFAKVNVADVLRRELARPGWTGEHVVIGTATDAYQPIEGRYRLTRHCLEVFRDAHNSLGITTKATLVLRDLDLLAELARVTRVKVNFTITTLDPELWRLIEPGTPPPAKRLAVLRRLRDAGIPAGVFMAPVLPGITDSAESIEAVAAAAVAHGAESLWVSPLRLAPLVKEHYYEFVQTAFPALMRRYESSYGGANAPRDYLDGLERRIERIKLAYGFDDPASGSHRHRDASASDIDRHLTPIGGQLSLPM